MNNIEVSYISLILHYDALHFYLMQGLFCVALPTQMKWLLDKAYDL